MAIGIFSVALTYAITHIWDVEIIYIAAMVAVLAFAVSQSMRVLLYEADRDQRRESMCQSLRLELDDTMESLGSAKYKSDGVLLTLDNGKKVYFINRYLNHGIYDSVLYSGDISLVRMESQQDLQNTYQLIKYHNKLLDQMTEISIRERTMYPKEADRIYVALDAVERRLLKEIPGIKNRI